jgi:hypothetical protein
MEVVQQLGSRQELSTAGAGMQRIHYMQHPVVQNEDIDVEATATGHHAAMLP